MAKQILLKEKVAFAYYGQSIILLRLLAVYLRNSTSKLEKFQNYFIKFVAPLPFGYITTVIIVRLAQKNNVGQLHQVTISPENDRS